jgi:hypothetical protein
MDPTGPLPVRPICYKQEHIQKKTKKKKTNKQNKQKQTTKKNKQLKI